MSFNYQPIIANCLRILIDAYLVGVCICATSGFCVTTVFSHLSRILSQLLSVRQYRLICLICVNSYLCVIRGTMSPLMLYRIVRENMWSSISNSWIQLYIIETLIYFQNLNINLDLKDRSMKPFKPSFKSYLLYLMFRRIKFRHRCWICVGRFLLLLTSFFYPDKRRLDLSKKTFCFARHVKRCLSCYLHKGIGLLATEVEEK